MKATSKPKTALASLAGALGMTTRSKKAADPSTTAKAAPLATPVPVAMNTNKTPRVSDNAPATSDHPTPTTSTAGVSTIKSARDVFTQLTTQVSNTNTHAKDTHTQVKNTNTQVKDTNTQVKNTNMQVKDTDTQVKNTDTQVKNTDTQIKDTDMEAKDADTETKDADTKAKDPSEGKLPAETLHESDNTDIQDTYHEEPSAARIFRKLIFPPEKMKTVYGERIRIHCDLSSEVGSQTNGCLTLLYQHRNDRNSRDLHMVVSFLDANATVVNIDNMPFKHVCDLIVTPTNPIVFQPNSLNFSDDVFIVLQSMSQDRPVYYVRTIIILLLLLSLLLLLLLLLF